ncbi:MAG: DUF1800 domain-containing protein [Verrucomicrobiales bacterium]
MIRHPFAGGLSRRHFLRLAAMGGAGASVGCSDSPFGFDTPAFLQFGSTDEPLAPFSAPDHSEICAVSHCLNRLSFGAVPGDYDRVSALHADKDQAADAFIKQQLDPESIDDTLAERATQRFEYLQHTPGDLYNFTIDGLLDEMLSFTVIRATKSKRQLQEVMVHFWTDHFNIDSSKGDCRWLTAAHDRDVIRRHAMGSFPELLKATAKSPAMLWYLDGRVNTKTKNDDKPNENYARELLELHTLGVNGGYTQTDVMEAARALTGWGVKDGLFGRGEPEFQKKHHDHGEKKILGHTIPAGAGHDDMDRLLDIVSLHPSTANYIATKLCARFIDDAPPTAAVTAVSKEFLASGGDIRKTLLALFQTNAFREHRGNKFKRPFHYIVSALRTTGGTTDSKEPLLKFLHRMGHAPFHYPTPDGYPEEATPWLSTIPWRWNFAIRYARNELKGTQCDSKALERLASVGGIEKAGLMPWLLGRLATADELEAWHACPDVDRLALLLGSPAFQLF